MMRRVWAWARAILRRGALEREMHEEMEGHLARATERLTARGLSGDEARRHARREFGNVGVIQEQARDARGTRWIETTVADLRYGARALVRSPLFTAVVVMSLALGIGANTAIFGVIYAVVFERLPIERPSELVELRRIGSAGVASDAFWDAEYRALAATPGVSLVAFTGAGTRPVVIAGTDESDVGEMIAVDGAFFRLLSIKAAAGRLISRADDDAALPVVVLSYELAQRHFPSVSDAVGSVVELRRQRFTVLGVTPREFRGLGVAGSFGMAIPMRAARQLVLSRERLERGQVSVIARVASRVETRARVEASLNRTFQRCCGNGELAPVMEGRTAPREEQLQLLDVSRGIPAGKLDIRAEYSRTLFLLFGGVVVLLMIACANVGNLMLARATSRARELAVRLSLGASRGRIVRQLLTESILLAVVGGTLGLLFAVWGTRALSSNLPATLSRLDNVVALRPNVVLLGFTALVALGSAALFGILPAFRSTRVDPVAGLRDGHGGSRRVGRLDRAVVVAQVALALVIVCAAGLLAATLRNLQQSASGFAGEHMLIADTEVRGTPYAQMGIRPIHGEMLRRIRALPGVTSAGFATRVPSAYGDWSPDEVAVPGYQAGANEDLHVDFISATPGYLDGVGVAIRRGRDVNSGDAAGSAPVAVVSESFARKFLPGRDPIGVTFHHRSDFGDSGSVTIVGVAADVKYYNLRAPALPTVYVPFAQAQDWGFLALAAQTSQPPSTFVQAVRSAMLDAAPGVTVRWVQPMQSMVDTRLAREHTVAWLAGLFAFLAVVMAAIGLYGVQAYQVVARVPEIGVRMALGASGGRIVWMVLQQSLIIVAVGSVIGVPLAIAAARAIGSQLYGVQPWQVETLVASAGLLAIVGLVASAIPAARAARVDPLTAIRVE